MSNAKSAQTTDRNQAIYRATVQGAAMGGATLMGKLVSAARLALQTREAASRDLRERDALADSAKQLRLHESTLCKKYPEYLLKAFASPDVSNKADKPTGEAPLFDQLELMDEVQVMTSVALARVQQVAMQVTETSLSDLNTLICSLLGLGTVRAESNPLRPEIYVHALKETLEQTLAPSAMQLDWINAMGATLSHELRALYGALCSSLRGDGVLSAAFSVTQTRAATGAGQGRGVAQQWGADHSSSALGGTVDAGRAAVAPNATERHLPQSEGAGGDQRRMRGQEDVLLTLDKLRSLLSGELQGGPDNRRVENFAAQFSYQFENGYEPGAATASSFAGTVPAALEALTEMRQIDRVVQSLEQRRKAGTAQGKDIGAGDAGSVEGMRRALRSEARGVAQALSLEVMTLMVDNMARDPRLLAPVQKLIRDLEPALLSLAMVDMRFFTDKQHIARQLLQDVTHRSMAFGAEDADGFNSFLGTVENLLRPLLLAKVDSAEPFARALSSLQQTWSSTSQINAGSRESAVEVLLHAEARNVLAEKIARGIDAHPDAKLVPAVVIDFLCGPWAQVVAQARIKGGAGSVAADKYQALIPALLWSAHPELARQSVSKLTRLVPRLLATMREGLETIHYPVTKTSSFFEALMAIHQTAFKATENPTMAFNPPQSVQRVHMVEGGNPWVAPEEARSTNFMEIPDVVPEQSIAASPVDVEGGQGTGIEGELPLGSWVELLNQDKWVRTQLTWASPHGTLFLFTSAHGTTQSMTRRSRERLVQTGRLRMVSGQAVVEVALEAVAQEAMRNSVETTL